ncbi:MAG: AraC family transcriptional regulator [Candidatus Berkelbacteria bacterium Gr01-1014_85]|uniref:AraC family transcriptional regulator n=1 Tax=Candidatus Berkelbacteria bacterium Gr01-1014_85 TaxID=2017150 RepID=A0A554JCF0_9BACT|nr:MAG: AraC family transcriptional regulator [Candidatus Berkelbacteria bacterium Gr01-1014_85]
MIKINNTESDMNAEQQNLRINNEEEKRSTIFERVRALGFPIGEYVVVGGVMEAHGLRKANDIDIVVTKKYFDELSQLPEWELQEFNYPDDRKYWLKGNGIDIMPGFSYNDAYRPDTEQLIAGADIINGIPFIKLEELLKWKRAANREKDQADIETIERYMAKL